MENSIIVIDDDRDYLEIQKKRLIGFGYRNVHIEDNPISAAALFEKGAIFDIALIDVNMPSLDGIKLLEMIRNKSPWTECIMVTAVNEARVAVECLQKGAYDYLLKPIPREDLAASIHRAMERKRLLDILEIEKSTHLPKLKNKAPFQTIISKSPNIFRVLKEAELHAQSDVPVLITGESGTGKELLARAIHAASPRSKFPFTPVNMASLTVSLFEAEFFGHTKGAFSGAAQGRVGYLEYTHHGTLFLDEIGNLQIELQAKLMRALQDGEYMKLGTSLHQKADVRFIAATNQHLERLMAQGRFRKDLYYRIRGGRLHLPPLRERKEDIPLLIDHFLKKESIQPVNSRIAEASMRLLLQHDYPGNIRELKSIMQSAVNLSEGKVISIASLPDYLRRRKPKSRTVKTPESEPLASLKQVEKDHILKVYNQMGKNKTRTAKMLGIGMNTLWRKLKVYEVD